MSFRRRLFSAEPFQPRPFTAQSSRLTPAGESAEPGATPPPPSADASSVPPSAKQDEAAPPPAPPSVGPSGRSAAALSAARFLAPLTVLTAAALTAGTHGVHGRGYAAGALLWTAYAGYALAADNAAGARLFSARAARLALGACLLLYLAAGAACLFAGGALWNYAALAPESPEQAEQAGVIFGDALACVALFSALCGAVSAYGGRTE